MITVDWPIGVISVQKVDMTLIQSNPEIYELNLNTFRLTLKDLEDNEDGIHWPKTHNHNPPVTVGGVQLARVIEILAPYTITFADGQYAVNLVGANSNVSDVVNVNQVSVRASNSAGLIQTGTAENLWNSTITGNMAPGTFGEQVGKKLLKKSQFLALK